MAAGYLGCSARAITCDSPIFTGGKIQAKHNSEKVSLRIGVPPLSSPRVRAASAFNSAIFAMFGDRRGQVRVKWTSQASPLRFAAGLHYLEIAFKEINAASMDGVEMAWLQVLGRRIGSYFALVSGLKAESEIILLDEL